MNQKGNENKIIKKKDLCVSKNFIPKKTFEIVITSPAVFKTCKEIFNEEKISISEFGRFIFSKIALKDEKYLALIQEAKKNLLDGLTEESKKRERESVRFSPEKINPMDSDVIYDIIDRLNNEDE